MNLSKYKPVSEDENAWTLHDGKGEFKVSKHALSHETHAQITKHFSGGGGVSGDSGKDAAPADQVVTGDDLPAIPQETPPQPGLFGDPMLQIPKGTGGAIVNALGNAATGVMGGGQPTPAAPQAPTQETPAPAATQPPPQAAPSIPIPKPLSAPGSLPGIESAIDKASQAQAGAAMDVGTAESNKALAQYGIYKDAADKAQQQYDDYQKRAQANQAQIDKAMADVAAGRVDPEHFMNSRTTGQKISSAIGMILGGIGAGMTGGQNPVMGIINGQIQRDVEAQKDNLENKKGLVRMYMEQGHDLRTSSELAMNAMKQITGAKLDAAGAQAGSPIALASAKQNAAKFIMDGKEGMLKAHGEVLNQIKTGLDIAQQRQQMALMPTQRAVQMAAAMGRVLPPEAQPFMDPELTVPVPGGVALARGKESASAIRDMTTAHADYEASLKELEALKDKTALIPKGELSREGQMALDHYAAASKALQGKSGLARTSEEDQIQKQMGNPVDVFRTAAGTQKLIDQARKMGMRHRGAVFAANLIGGRQAAAGIEAPNGR